MADSVFCRSFCVVLKTCLRSCRALHSSSHLYSCSEVVSYTIGTYARNGESIYAGYAKRNSTQFYAVPYDRCIDRDPGRIYKSV